MTKETKAIKNLEKVIESLDNYKKSKKKFSKINSTNIPSYLKNTYESLTNYFSQPRNKNSENLENELDIKELRAEYLTEKIIQSME
jgi:uncharacterized protein Yka (UPF0111/DUF47 family)